MVTTETKEVALSDVHLNEKNPRKITKQALDKLSKSIEGFADMLKIREIVVDETMTVLGGNMRYQALEASGAKTCIVKIVTGLTEEQKREFIVKDNVDFGEWDMAALQNWDDLPLADWGIFVKKPSELAKEILSEQEYIEAKETAEHAIGAFTEKIKTIAERHPEHLNHAMAVVCTNGRGNEVLFLSDPNTADIVKELRRISESGEKSPLEILVKELHANGT